MKTDTTTTTTTTTTNTARTQEEQENSRKIITYKTSSTSLPLSTLSPSFRHSACRPSHHCSSCSCCECSSRRTRVWSCWLGLGLWLWLLLWSDIVCIMWRRAGGQVVIVVGSVLVLVVWGGCARCAGCAGAAEGAGTRAEGVGGISGGS